MENKSTTGWLCKGLSFKDRRLFLDPKEYAQAKSEGWNTGPVDAYRAKLATEKEAKEPDFFDVGKPEGEKYGPPVEAKRKYRKSKKPRKPRKDKEKWPLQEQFEKS